MLLVWCTASLVPVNIQLSFPFNLHCRLFQLLTHSATPILKQASPLQAWYEHLFVPDGGKHTALAHFGRNLSDLPQRADRLLHGMGYDPQQYHRQHGIG